MKHILIIDESSLFRDYLRLKIEENGVEAITGINAMDGISKMRNMIPDLIIMDYYLGRQGFIEVLRQKRLDPNTANIPVIILAQRIDQRQLLELVPYNVKKVFNKPIKIDALFSTLTELLGVPFSIDESPGIVEVHVNDSIIFIEIAQGLNRDKLDLLRFKIVELIDLYDIRVPKVIVMLSDIKLGFADAPNMKKLLTTVLQASKAKLRYIRILTRDDFVRQFVKGQKEYTDIEVVTNLQYAMDGLLADIDSSVEEAEKKAEIISDKLLQVKPIETREAVALKFDIDSRNADFELARPFVQGLKIAVIDDDFVVQETIRNSFQKAGAEVFAFAGGEEFLSGGDIENYCLAFLAINMSGVGGIEVLKVLRDRNIRYPVIALSAVIQRETMTKAYQMGIKSYLVKPVRPDDILKKSVEALEASF